MFLSDLPADLIRAAYKAATGNEIASGIFLSPESSAALVANAFGLFLDRLSELPPLPGCAALGWSATSVRLEAVVRFPWSGGRYPCLDVLVETKTVMIGVELKRFEPFRSKPATVCCRMRTGGRVWGDAMAGYQRVRDMQRDGGWLSTTSIRVNW